ncbi:hypothetical protein DM860_002947 [Cuscuta australis]|uniref:Bystin n=1 Tax=Cuscuta australis TaxID=267555 RepID=A0A328D1V3_9ASTE|nr:hypothetical protein DM860_002947 [Cuscuta australis]
MAKKRDRVTNPEPFLAGADESSKASSRKRSKAPKSHQEQQKVLSSGMSSKILKEALIQQKEVEEEEAQQQNHGGLVFKKDLLPEVEEEENDDNDDNDDLDNFTGFSETNEYVDVEDKVDEEEERLLAAFLSTDDRPQRTLADIVIERLKEKDAQASTDLQVMPNLDVSIINLYKEVGQSLSKYTSGKIPKAFKHIPAMRNWEDVLYLTEPDKWSPNAMYQATRLFASAMGTSKVERFYKFVLLPRVRADIKKNKKLHFSLHQSLKKALFKPAAFNKGILFPLCESRTCTTQEAKIFKGVLQKSSFPALHASVALLKLAEMEYCGTTSFFIQILIEKKYALPYRVLDAMVAHFWRSYEEPKVMPVIWHLSLLCFVRRYKADLLKEDKSSIIRLVEKQRHHLITPEILQELNKSRSRGEKEADPMPISTPVCVMNKTIDEDRFDIPEVPMEED